MELGMAGPIKPEESGVISMNKKILTLLFLLILLVSVTISYAYFSQPATNQDNQINTDGTIDDTTLSSEIDSTLLDEDQGVEIGDMI
jgi:hypothetical protein